MHIKFKALAILCGWLISSGTAHALNIGDPFPDFAVPNTLSPQHSAYLGVEPALPIKLGEIQRDLIIVEFLNVYCYTCRIQVSVFNALKEAIADDPDLRGRVSLLGFAVGNSQDEIATFVNDFGAEYPILSDQGKELFNRTGNIRGTPHTYVVRRDERGFIVDYHAGGVSSPERYLDSIRHTLRSSLTGTQPGNKIPELAFYVDGEMISTRELDGQPYFLYFATSRMHDVALDTRNVAVQLDILSTVVGDAVDVFVFQPPDADPQADPVPIPLVQAYDEEHAVRALFAPDDRPGILYVNEFGRIVYRGESITLPAATRLIEGKEYVTEPSQSRQEIQTLIRNSVNAAGHTVVEIESMMLANRQELHIVSVAPQGSGVFFFARVESGITMCDVCHDTHFIYLFDQSGAVIDFIGLGLFKYGNIEWSDDDIDIMKNNLVSRSIFERFSFDPAVDAITTATMTSSMIYEAMDKAHEHFDDFYEYRFREAHWKTRCFLVICKVRSAVERLRQQDPDASLDDSTLQKILSETGLRGCPTGGMYIVLDGDVLCSQHGLNLEGCGK